MKEVILIMDDALYAFYQKVGKSAGGLKPEK